MHRQSQMGSLWTLTHPKLKKEGAVSLPVCLCVHIVTVQLLD